MHVSVATDARYLPHAAAAMHSVLEHAPGVHLHLLHTDELPRERELRAMAERAGGRLTLHRVAPSRVAGLPVARELSAAMWLRVFLPELLPDVERVLYLDADTLAMSALAPLWQTELAGAYVAAVTNVWEPWNSDHPQRLGVQRYFNSGVLLLDLERMRADGCTAALLETARSERVLWPDQDALNLVLGARSVELHPRWNVMNSVLAFPQAVDAFGAERVAEARRSPGIRHFEGPSLNKPWHILFDQPGRDDYLRHRAATPWAKVRRTGVTPRNLVRRALRRTGVGRG